MEEVFGCVGGLLGLFEGCREGWFCDEEGGVEEDGVEGG